MNWYLEHLCKNCPGMNSTGHHWWEINIDSGNGLVLSVTKPLSEPMLTKFHDALWHKASAGASVLTHWGRYKNGRHFPDDIFKCIFLNESVWISIKFSLKFVPKGPIDNIPALVQIMAWRRSGDKPLSEPMMVSLLTHLCVTRPQWVKPGFRVLLDWMRARLENVAQKLDHGQIDKWHVWVKSFLWWEVRMFCWCIFQTGKSGIYQQQQKNK